MADTTEIYLCRAGQDLKQGKVEYSDSITNKADAEADAIQRCKWNKKLAKIAYYAVNTEGDFRIILTYNNPNIGNDEPEKPKKVKKKPVKKPSLVKRVIRAVTGKDGGKKTKTKKAKAKTKNAKAKAKTKTKTTR
ncbi:MAG: hypothetical protein H8E36_00290 [Rhodospirillaceae bacterium]|nr:hypothetical protein [Rhodospirillaceae bacterium]MBL6930905.1 hypothetical protein [Rhodospirillales bacterium]MBL6942129.1 hypothetical protein [Rhodospirillales bacterium]